MWMTMSGKDSGLRLQMDGPVARITIDRPEQRNAFNTEMWRELRRLVDRIAADGSLRVLMIEGEGGEAFTSGSDIGELARLALADVNRSFEEMEAAISAVENLPVPTIAVIQGYALGGGLELALACDLRVASEGALLGMPVARLGIMISARFAKRLVDLIGPSRTKDLLYTGRFVPAREAHALGMLNYLVPPEQLRQAALDLAKRIAAHSASSVRAGKAAVTQCLPLAEASRSEEPYFVDPHDFPEGVEAFLARRPPRF